MNYFPFDPCPRQSAIALDDKRLARVFHESVMVLSKMQHKLTGQLGPYSPTVPVPGALMRWALAEGEDWMVEWTAAMFAALIDRNGRDRVEGYRCGIAYAALAPRFRDKVCDVIPSSFPNLARAQVKGLDFTHVEDTHDAYRQYLRAQWWGTDLRPSVWTHHGEPGWARGLTPAALPAEILEIIGP